MPDVVVNGRKLSAPGGTMLSTALAAAGVAGFRESVTGEPRGPLCGMGICFECRVTVDGRPHVRSCQAVVEEAASDRLHDGYAGKYDILVIGAGPAGLAAACRAAEGGAHVAIIDDNLRPGGQI